MVDFAASMRGALDLVRSQRLQEATELIKCSLARPDTVSQSGSISRQLVERRPRRPLGEVVNALHRGKPPKFGLAKTPVRRHRARLIIPDGAQFLDLSFSCSAGARRYKLYIPKHRAGNRPALLVMLHGCTQNPDDFAIGTRMNDLAETNGMLVAYPEQTKSANPSACWNWFSPKDQRNGTGEPSIIAGITRAIISQNEVDPRRVYIAGLSAGGAMAVVMGEAYPDLFAAVGVHSGLPYQSASDVISAFAAMRGDFNRSIAQVSAQTPMPTIVFHGDIDSTVHPANGETIAQAQHGMPSMQTVDQGRSEGGLSFTRTLSMDASGQPVTEHWLAHGIGHAWSGGSADGSYTDPRGPDASREMLRFFGIAAATST